ncbi:hypothetical protein BVRB_5g101410 [Beta vulgaris subsp. vulgaris]|nr:hypothetical protein BVRB_5g101410 [Beta vulgaris subsp. vulgaris]
MVNQLKKSLVSIAMVMLVMAYAVSAARILATLPADVTWTVEVGPVKLQAQEGLAGCANVADPANVEACGSVGPPIKAHLKTPLASDLPGQTGN